MLQAEPRVMNYISKLPTELAQAIGSFLSISDKYAFKASSKSGSKLFYDDQHERSEFWDLIFEDTTWPESKISDGYQIVLVGSSIKDIKKHKSIPHGRNLVIALAFSSEGKRPYGPIEPSKWKLFLQNRSLFEQYCRDRKDFNKTILKELRAALRSKEYDAVLNYVQYDGFQLHIGQIIGDDSFDGVEKLLLPDKKSTLLIYYKGGPEPMDCVEVEFEDSKASIRRERKEVTVLHDLDISGWRK